MAESSGESLYIELTADIVSAYVSNNPVSSAEITNLIGQVYSALKRVAGGQVSGAVEPLKPAVPIKRSVTPEYIVCLEDGKKFKSLKRHLRTRYSMTPDQYREKWGLPPDYSMVASNYAAARSQLAKQMGLGQQRRRRRERDWGWCSTLQDADRAIGETEPFRHNRDHVTEQRLAQRGLVMLDARVIFGTEFVEHAVGFGRESSRCAAVR